MSVIQQVCIVKTAGDGENKSELKEKGGTGNESILEKILAG